MKASRIHQAARKSPDQVAKIIQVQEAQIADLKAQLAAADAVLLGVCEMYVWDYIDPQTGEVTKGRKQ